ncbi:MAG TPA: cytosine permease [Micromonosporaceae bacterium]|nr:cytosine permease [Micromonosporaceae bacterium]
MTASTAVLDDMHAEPGRTLDDVQPRTLGFWDQVALWGNLGISLLGPTGAIFLIAPHASMLGALVAVIVGTAIGTLLVALAAVAGARSGRPAMVLLRGLFGKKLSYLPTVLNLAQLLGWATFELVVIAAALKQLLPWHVQWAYIVIAGVITTVMAIWPLGVVRLLRRYALIAVLAAIAYLFIQLGRNPIPPLAHGSWSGFWTDADVVIAVAVSWVPLAADYTRHSRTERAAFGGAMIGYTVTQVICYALGLLAFTTVVSAAGTPDQQQHNLFAAFIAVPVGWLAFAVLVARELDESFANVYSTAVSIQNPFPKASRQVLAIGVGTVATVGALILKIGAYQDFLYLLGSLFVPMFAVFAVRYFLLDRNRPWDTSENAPSRWSLLVPWVVGFIAYQIINPGSIGWWVTMWTQVQGWLRFTPQTWMSASVISFVVAAVLTLAMGAFDRPRPMTASVEPLEAPSEVVPQ